MAEQTMTLTLPQAIYEQLRERASRNRRRRGVAARQPQPADGRGWRPARRAGRPAPRRRAVRGRGAVAGRARRPARPSEVLLAEAVALLRARGTTRASWSRARKPDPRRPAPAGARPGRHRRALRLLSVERGDHRRAAGDRAADAGGARR